MPTDRASDQSGPGPAPAGLRALVDGRWFQGVILVLIIGNALILGAETFDRVDAAFGPALAAIDRVIIYAFVIELTLRMLAYRGEYLKNGWNVFDLIIVMVSLVAATSGLAALRAFRVLRVLRVITVVPRMRIVVSALLDAIPGIASVGVIVMLIVYVFAVIAATLYGPAHPQLFGDVFAAMYTLFQVMTLEGWPDIAAAVAETHPRSWIFFMAFVLIATFTMMNLFIAIVVRVVEEEADTGLEGLLENQQQLSADIAALRTEVAEIGKRLR